MKIIPIIANSINTTHTSFKVELNLDNNITFITGNAGVGKSLVFSFLKEYALEDNRVRCYNYLDLKSNYKTAIKNSKGKLFIIDNADILLNNDMRQYIAMDTSNQYIIIGRNPTGLLLSIDEIVELQRETTNGITRFTLQSVF